MHVTDASTTAGISTGKPAAAINNVAACITLYSCHRLKLFQQIINEVVSFANPVTNNYNT